MSTELKPPKPLYIFDLDGTLADIRHRQHLVTGKNRQWDEFFLACVDDKPNWPVIVTARGLFFAQADIAIFSGRSTLVEEETHRWLDEYLGFAPYVIRMRTHGDSTPDEVLKQRWYEDLSVADRRRLVAVFDDRAKVVARWRLLGVACFQVAPGDF